MSVPQKVTVTCLFGCAFKRCYQRSTKRRAQKRCPAALGRFRSDPDRSLLLRFIAEKTPAKLKKLYSLKTKQ
jgi:hypothetical protein